MLEEDRLWCYPPAGDDDYRLCSQATNNWLGTIETKTGDEIVDLADWACEDFAAAFKFAQDTVRAYNKARFNTVLEDYS